MSRSVEALHFEVAEPLRALFSAAADPRYDGGWSMLTPAIQVSVSLYHFVEKMGKRGGGCSYNGIRAGCPDLELVHDVATLAKHDASRARHARVSAMSDLHALLEVTLYEDDFGSYRHCRNRLLLNTDNGERDYLEVLANAFTAVNSCVGKTTGTALKDLTPPSNPVFVERAHANEEMSLHIVAGFEFRAAFRVLTYDHSSGEAHPMDLSGQQVRFRIRGLAPE